ncbi:hypothetical protein [Clostridium tetani]|uniref:hypothetical protein n=1 Tax=Clostridium tetani TaxID=1513 RepID=UPI00100C10AD|nr:hypothetical protein [Clostridium tetani]RXM72699.1 hypothetical protein DP143_09150 [Clostridium tetani]
MNNIPECMYDYRYEFEKVQITDNCCNCDCTICEGDEYYDIDGTILCEECIRDYKHTAEL